MTKINVITSYIKGQMLKWFGHVKQKEAINRAKEIME